MTNSVKLKLSVIIPVYNEAGIVREVITHIQRVLAGMSIGHEVIVVNDASRDQTLELLHSIAGITILSNPYNLGYGASIKRGLRAAQGEWIMIIDGDGTYPPEKIPELFSHTAEYDMVVGQRDQLHDPAVRRPAKWILRRLASFLVGRHIPDLNSGMRIFRRDLAMEFYQFYPPRFSFTTTITIAFLVNHYAVRFVPIAYHQRVGESHIRPWHFIDFFALVIKLILYFRPLKMLALPIAALLVLGAAKGIKDIMLTGGIGNLAVISVLFAFQTFVLALILEVITKKR